MFTTNLEKFIYWEVLLNETQIKGEMFTAYKLSVSS